MPENEKKKSKYTSEDLKHLQNLSLDEKIQLSKARIIEFSEKMDNKIYVSFSGGKDSTVLLHLVRSVYPDTVAAYIDTGLEYPELREFVKTVPNVTWLKPKKNFKRVILEHGYPIISKKISGYVSTARKNPNSIRAKYLKGEIPSKMFGFGDGKYWYLTEAPFESSDYCCSVMKKQPNHKFQKESGLKPIFGTMAVESVNRRNEWLRVGCNSFDGEQMSKPISFWTEQDVLEYIVRYNLDYASVYGDIVKDENGKWHTTGCNRSGCLFCAYGCHLEREPNRFQQLKVTHPKIWNYCMKPIEEGGLGMRTVLEYIGVKTE